MPQFFEGKLDATGQKFGVVVSRFNSFICERLLEGAVDALVRHGVDDKNITVARVPGAFEIPLFAKRADLSWRGYPRLYAPFRFCRL